MACPRCGNDNCACTGNTVPQDWREQISMQLRAHQIRKRRKMVADAPLLDFDGQAAIAIQEGPSLDLASLRAANRSRNVVVEAQQAASAAVLAEDPQPAAWVERIEELPHAPEVRFQPQAVEDLRTESDEEWKERLASRPPLAPFPRIAAPVPKVIQFPHAPTRSSYELAEPVADQLRIFEAVEELPLPAITHLNEIEIAPEEPICAARDELELPLQTAPIALRTYAAVVDGIVLLASIAWFWICAEFFAKSLQLGKPLLAAGAVSSLVLLTLYYWLMLSYARATAGTQAAGLRIATFAGEVPSLARLRWRAFAIVLSYAALGMGFAWSLIDEDRLCWHDRITHTYLQTLN